MREIKFRAWTGEKMRPCSVSENGMAIMDFGESKAPLMQFTGLLDKNRKEIYEGDIKRWKFNEHIWDSVCYWSEIDCGFRWRMIAHNAIQSDDTVDIPFDTEEQYYKYFLDTHTRMTGFDSWDKIIGNIHENPELLK